MIWTSYGDVSLLNIGNCNSVHEIFELWSYSEDTAIVNVNMGVMVIIILLKMRILRKKLIFENKKTVAGYLSFNRYSDLWVKWRNISCLKIKCNSL